MGESVPSGMLWDLFTSPAKLTANLTAPIDDRVQTLAASRRAAEAVS